MKQTLVLFALLSLQFACKKNDSASSDLTKYGQLTLNNNGKNYVLELDFADRFTRSGVYTEIWFYTGNEQIDLSFRAVSTSAPSYVGKYDIPGWDCFVREKFQGGIVFDGDRNNRKIGEMIVTESTDTYKKGTYSFTAKSASNSGNQTRTFTGTFVVNQ